VKKGASLVVLTKTPLHNTDAIITLLCSNRSTNIRCHVYSFNQAFRRNRKTDGRGKMAKKYLAEQLSLDELLLKYDISADRVYYCGTKTGQKQVFCA
jgi:hypothetical protein